jgi:hypothetical protein
MALRSRHARDAPSLPSLFSPPSTVPQSRHAFQSSSPSGSPKFVDTLTRVSPPSSGSNLSLFRCPRQSRLAHRPRPVTCRHSLPLAHGESAPTTPLPAHPNFSDSFIQDQLRDVPSFPPAVLLCHNRPPWMASPPVGRCACRPRFPFHAIETRRPSSSSFPRPWSARGCAGLLELLPPNQIPRTPNVAAAFTNSRTHPCAPDKSCARHVHPPYPPPLRR